MNKFISHQLRRGVDRRFRATAKMAIEGIFVGRDFGSEFEWKINDWLMQDLYYKDSTSCPESFEQLSLMLLFAAEFIMSEYR